MSTESDEKRPDASGGSALGAFLPLLAPHRSSLVLGFVLTLAIALVFQAGPLLIRRAIDHEISGRDLHGLVLTVGLFLLAQGILVALGYARRGLLEGIGLSAVTSIKTRLFERVLRAPISFYDRTAAGSLVARIENDAEQLRELFSVTSVALAGDGLKLVVSFTVMIALHPPLALLTLAVLACAGALSIGFDRYAAPTFLGVREKGSELTGFMHERLKAVPLIQAFRVQRGVLDELARLQAAKYRLNLKLSVMWNVYFNILLFSETLAICACLGYGGWLVHQGAATVGTVLMFVEYVRRLFDPVFRLGEQLGVIQKSRAAAQRVRLLIELPGEPDEVAPERARPWTRLERDLEFRDVTFGYDPARPVLDGVSFRIPRGEKWALVGPTGAGKSTIIGLILRFFDPQKGQILVDGIDLREIPRAALRAQTSLVLQESLVIEGTVRENLRLGVASGPTGQEEWAARWTGADRIIAGLPEAYETPLDSGGTRLSMGERQLINLTRALARNPDLLILDEATASVDPATERLLQRATKSLLEGRTALVVAHRLSTVRDCDRILVLEGGRIVETGTHRELMATGGRYATSHALQFPDERPAAAPSARVREALRA